MVGVVVLGGEAQHIGGWVYCGANMLPGSMFLSLVDVVLG